MSDTLDRQSVASELTFVTVKSTAPLRSSRATAFASAWLAVFLLIGGYFGWNAVQDQWNPPGQGNGAHVSASMSAGVSPTSAAAAAGYRSFTKPIVSVDPGEWALADNPENNSTEDAAAQNPPAMEIDAFVLPDAEEDAALAAEVLAALREGVDGATTDESGEALDGALGDEAADSGDDWEEFDLDLADEIDEDDLQPNRLRLVTLRLAKPSGGDVRMKYLRNLAWMEQKGVRIGGRIRMELDELGAVGWAQVLSVEPCPAIGPRPSRQHHLVTGTFAHSASNVIEVRVAGAADSLRVTANHRFWSADRSGFIPAGELRHQEQLLLPNGGLSRVATVSHDAGTAPVYNLEVAGEHVYYVGSTGVLVHNSNCGPNPWGRRGSPAHVKRIEQAEVALTKKGWDVYSGGSLKEKRFGNRFPDLVMQKGKDLIAIQVGRATKGGLPVIRERRAITDLRSLTSVGKSAKFKHVFFIKY